jgi:hypothetical protein
MLQVHGLGIVRQEWWTGLQAQRAGREADEAGQQPTARQVPPDRIIDLRFPRRHDSAIFRGKSSVASVGRTNRASARRTARG